MSSVKTPGHTSPGDDPESADPDPRLLRRRAARPGIVLTQPPPPPPTPARPTGDADPPDDDHVTDRRPDSDVIGDIDRVLEDLSGE